MFVSLSTVIKKPTPRQATPQFLNNERLSTKTNFVTIQVPAKNMETGTKSGVLSRIFPMPSRDGIAIPGKLLGREDLRTDVVGFTSLVARGIQSPPTE